MTEYEFHETYVDWFFEKWLEQKEAPLAHKIVKSVASDMDPLSFLPSPCTDYTSRCGMMALEYGGNGQVETVFCKTLEEATAQGAVLCQRCCFLEAVAKHTGELELGVLYEEIRHNQLCPECGRYDLVVRYRILNGGACDTSEWTKACVSQIDGVGLCYYFSQENAPNTSDFAY